MNNQKNSEADVVKTTITKSQDTEIEHKLVKTFDMKIPKAIPTTIKFTSRASVKITHKGQDHYYTVEYGEERQINNFDEVDLAKERQFLIDDCNAIVDDQIEEITKTFLK